MATRRTTTPETTEAEMEITAEGTINAEISQISRVKDDKKRIQITLKNVKFKTIDFQTGREIVTDSFSIDAVNFLQMVAETGESYGSLFNAVCMRERPNIVIFPLLYNGGKITINRKFKRSTDLRENSTETYGKNLYKTNILSITATSNVQQINMAMTLMQSNPVEKDTSSSMPMKLTI